jgi:hypothetical protein
VVSFFEIATAANVSRRRLTVPDAHSGRTDRMTLDQIKKKAADLGIIQGKMTKETLIRAIQKVEGHVACFGTGDTDCPFVDCCFRNDCLNGKRRK